MKRPRGALAGGISPLSQRCTRWAGHHLRCRGAYAQLLAAGQVDGPLPGGSEDHPLFQTARPTCNLQRRRKHVAKAFRRPSLLARRQAGLLDAPAAAALPSPRAQSQATNVHYMACLYAFTRLSTLSGSANKLVTNAVLDEVLHHSVWVRGSCCDCAVGQLTEHIPLWL